MSARRCAAVLLVVAVALGACAKKAQRTQGGSPSPTATAATASGGLPAIGLPPPSPSSSVTCAIVGVAEVNAALGTTATARHLDSSPPATVCTYAGGTSSRTVIVRFQTGQDANAFADDKAVYDSGGQTTTAVSGYGDEAFSSVLPVPGSVGVTTLVARKGDVEVLISAPTALGPVETLMQKILSQF
jgi:hypothetical protein